MYFISVPETGSLEDTHMVPHKFPDEREGGALHLGAARKKGGGVEMEWGV